MAASEVEVSASPVSNETGYRSFELGEFGFARDEYFVYIDQFLLDHADIATGISLGYSHEGREIRGVVINAGGGDKPAVLFNGTQHAREWISPPTTMYIADTLADGYGVDPTITALLNKVEVIVIPVVNPDGYEYTYAPSGESTITVVS